VLGGLQNSLAAFIGRMIGKVTGAEVKADVKGMKGDKADPKSEKGAPLGDPGGHLLHGVGYGTKDARTQLKNKVEEANVNRFLESQQEGKEPIAKAKTGEPETTEKREGELERKTEAQETREARDKDVKREDQKDDARVQGRQDTKEQLEQRDQREAREKERQKERDDRDDEEQKHGGAWAFEEAAAEEEQPAKRGLASTREVYADNARCKGILDDGTRCLRKPVKGVGYCREHAVNWRPDLDHKA
jgi:hypothetical protein